MVRKSRRQTKTHRRTRTRRTSYRKMFPMELRKNYRKSRGGKLRRRKSRGRKSRVRKLSGGKSRKKTRYTPDEFITSDRVITRFSEVFKHPINYVTKSTIPLYLDKKTLDPINSAELSSLAAHIGLDASEM